MLILELDESINYKDYLEILTYHTCIAPNEITYHDYLEQLHRIQQNENHTIYVAKDGHNLVGCYTLLVEPVFSYDMDNRGYVKDIVVLPSYEKTNLRQQLLDHAAAICRENKCTEMSIICDIDNIYVYNDAGFKLNNITMTIDI